MEFFVLFLAFIHRNKATKKNNRRKNNENKMNLKKKAKRLIFSNLQFKIKSRFCYYFLLFLCFDTRVNRLTLTLVPNDKNAYQLLKVIENLKFIFI